MFYRLIYILIVLLFTNCEMENESQMDSEEKVENNNEGFSLRAAPYGGRPVPKVISAGCNYLHDRNRPYL